MERIGPNIMGSSQFDAVGRRHFDLHIGTSKDLDALEAAEVSDSLEVFREAQRLGIKVPMLVGMSEETAREVHAWLGKALGAQ